MTRNKTHLSRENREVIQEGLRNGDSARLIAKRIDVSPSTITREVKMNRTIKEKKRSTGSNLSLRCANYKDCQLAGKACEKCYSKLTTCKNCKTRNCIDYCDNFEQAMCPKTLKWPYICPDECPKKMRCTFPKCTYSALDASDISHTRLTESRSGIALTENELKAMDALVSPLVKQGQSFEAIWSNHSEELFVGVRSAYNYQKQNIFSFTNLDLPRIAACRPRKRNKSYVSGTTRVNRKGRTYDDFLALPITDQVMVVQGDSVEGYKYNKHDILSLHVLRCYFQFYFYKEHADSSSVVKLFDIIEIQLGSPEEFEAMFGILLVDRGCEFDDWEGMERSCLVEGIRRCRVFYCDPQESNQKSQAERNHEQLRRILPKHRSDFDKLSAADVSICCSHVNSYPNADRQGKCPFDFAREVIPSKLLEAFSIEQLEPDNVILKPYLMSHVVAQ